jgi:hypothetical protein
MWFVKIQSALLPLWRAKLTQPVLATLCGVLLYLWLPLFKAPDWLVQLNSLSSEEQQQQLKTLNRFYKKYGEAALPALNAQLELDKLRRFEQQLIDDNKNFDDQDRDALWAEATEFMIAHLTQNVANNQLRLLDSECRNNLCRMVLEAPQGLTPEYRALVLKLAGSLKTGDLEFQQLTEGNKRITLELKSDKRLKYGYFASKKLNPPQKAQWQAEIKTWLQ